MNWAIKLTDVWVFYDGLAVLENVNLAIPDGRYVGVLGPNGAGKSTLIKVILGLVPPTRGEVEVFGDSPMKQRRRGHIVGYLPQRPLSNPLFPVTALDVVLMGRCGRIGLLRRPSPADVDFALGYLESLGIRHLARRLIGELSGG